MWDRSLWANRMTHAIRIQLHHDQATDLCLVLDLMWNHFCKMEFRSIRISDPKTSCPSCKLRNRQKWKLNKISLQKEIFMGESQKILESDYSYLSVIAVEFVLNQKITIASNVCVASSLLYNSLLCRPKLQFTDFRKQWWL